MREKLLIGLRTALLLGLMSLTMSTRANSVRAATEREIELTGMVGQAVSADDAEARAAIAKLRDAGPEGLNALIASHRDEIDRALELSPLERSGHPKWQRLKFAFEKVGAQCDNWASQLYWFTDMEKAKAQAQKENKPILSLRLLGNLDDELSCANSRFFRTALYPNESIQRLLQSTFILHWQSVRPVPKVTIDFGDGRKIQTTLTGNSIHYVLDAKGRVLDGLPGLHGPGAFEAWLRRSQSVWQASHLADGPRAEYLREYHQQRLAQITREWQTDVGRLKLAEDFSIDSSMSVAVGPVLVHAPSQTGIQIKAQAAMPPRAELAEGEELMRVTARLANRNAFAKAAMVETRILKEITVPLPRDRHALQRTTTDALWEKIAALHEAEAKLDENSLKVLQAKSLNPDKAAFAFEKSVAEDTVRNQYMRHPVIHEWLAQNPNAALDEFNKRVYAELFLTPDSDPWLGLLPVEAYSALQNDGVVTH